MSKSIFCKKMSLSAIVIFCELVGVPRLSAAGLDDEKELFPSNSRFSAASIIYGQNFHLGKGCELVGVPRLSAAGLDDEKELFPSSSRFSAASIIYGQNFPLQTSNPLTSQTLRKVTPTSLSTTQNSSIRQNRYDDFKFRDLLRENASNSKLLLSKMTDFLNNSEDLDLYNIAQALRAAQIKDCAENIIDAIKNFAMEKFTQEDYINFVIKNKHYSGIIQALTELRKQMPHLCGVYTPKELILLNEHKVGPFFDPRTTTLYNIGAFLRAAQLRDYAQNIIDAIKDFAMKKFKRDDYINLVIKKKDYPGIIQALTELQKQMPDLCGEYAPKELILLNEHKVGPFLDPLTITLYNIGAFLRAAQSKDCAQNVIDAIKDFAMKKFKRDDYINLVIKKKDDVMIIHSLTELQKQMPDLCGEYAPKELILLNEHKVGPFFDPRTTTLYNIAEFLRAAQRRDCAQNIIDAIKAFAMEKFTQEDYINFVIKNKDDVSIIHSLTELRKQMPDLCGEYAPKELIAVDQAQKGDFTTLCDLRVQYADHPKFSLKFNSILQERFLGAQTHSTVQNAYESLKYQDILALQKIFEKQDNLWFGFASEAECKTAFNEETYLTQLQEKLTCSSQQKIEEIYKDAFFYAPTVQYAATVLNLLENSSNALIRSAIVSYKQKVNKQRLEEAQRRALEQNIRIFRKELIRNRYSFEYNYSLGLLYISDVKGVYEDRQRFYKAHPEAVDSQEGARKFLFDNNTVSESRLAALGKLVRGETYAGHTYGFPPAWCDDARNTLQKLGYEYIGGPGGGYVRKKGNTEGPFIPVA